MRAKLLFFLIFATFISTLKVKGQCTPIINSNPATTNGCETFTIQFTDASSCVIQQRLWNFGDGITSSVQNPSHSFNAGIVGDTSYTVQLSLQDLGGTWHSTSKTVNVYKKPSVSFSVNKATVCAIVDSIHFTNSSPMPVGSSLVWDFGDGSPTSTVANPYHTYNTPGNYISKLTITNANNCSQFITKPIVVNEIPNPNFSQSVVASCTPFPVTFTNTTVQGTFPITSWLWDFGGLSTSNLQQPGTVNFSVPAIYAVSLSATNTAGCTNKTVNNVIAKKTPTATFSLPAEVCLGDTAIATYTGNGLAGATYTWNFSSPQSTVGSGQGPVKVVWNSFGSKTVSLQVTENGCSGNFSTGIIVNELPVVTLTTDDLNDSICEAQPITFIAAPDTFVSYSFYNLGSQVQSSNSNVFVQNNLIFPNSVTVVALDSNGCSSVSSASKSVMVFPKPVITLTASEDTVCHGDNITFTASGSFDKYTFMNGFLNLQSSTANSFITDTVDDGNEITAYATQDGCDGDLSNAIKINVNEPLETPRVNCGKSTNTSVTFVWDDDPKVISYEIQLNGGGFNSVAARVREDVGGLAFGDTVWAQVYGIGDLPCGNTLVSDSVFCIAKPCDSLLFNTTSLPAICAGDTVTLGAYGFITPSANFGVSFENQAFSRDSNYTFIADVTKNILITVVDSSQLSCPAFSKLIKVKVNTLPQVTFSTSKQNLCQGVYYTFTADHSGYDQYNFYVNDTLQQDSSYHIYRSNNFVPGSTTVVMETIEKGCSSKDTIQVNVVAKQQVHLTVASDSVCAGTIINYTATLGFDHYEFRNSVSNKLLADTTLNTYSSSVYNKVKVVGIDQYGCSSYADAKTIVIKKLPVVNITSNASADSICENTSVKFTLNPAASHAYQFWDNYYLTQQSAANTFITTNIQEGHYYYGRAILNGCYGPFTDSLSFKVRTKMPQPVVNCGLTGNGQMQFTWDSVATSRGYLVSVNNGAYFTPSTGNKGLAHIVTGLAPLDTVCLRVISRGVIPCGNSIPSSPICCIMPCAPVTFSQNFTSITVCKGDSVTMLVKNISSPTGVYEIGWNGGPADNILRKKFLPLKDTIVFVSAWDTTQSECTPTTKFFEIKVNEKPDVTLVGDTNFCSDEQIVLQASPTNYDKYQFYDRLLPIASGANPVQIDSVVKDGHYYTVVATNKGCKDTSNVVRIHVSKKLEVPDVFCGLTTTSSVEIMWDSVPGATGYEISLNGYPYAIPSSGSTGLFNLTSGMSTGDSVVAIVRALGAAPCSYSNASPAKHCIAKNCALVNFKKTKDLEICAGEVVNLKVSNIQAPSLQVGISWDGGNTAGTQSVFAKSVYRDSVIIVGVLDSTQLNCPVNLKTINIDVTEIPTFNLISNASNDSVCEGEVLLLQSDVVGYDSYQFFIDDVQVQDSILYQYSTSNLTVGTHEVKVNSDNLGCYYLSDSIDFTVVSYPVLNITSSDDNDTVCAGASITFKANSGYELYSFFNNGSLLQTGSDSVFVVNNIQDGDEVFVIGSNRNLCFKTSDTISTKVWAIPSFDLISSDADNIICANDTVTFSMNPAADWYVVYNNVDSLGKYMGVTFMIDTLQTSDKIYIVGALHGCTDHSDTIQTTVEFTPTAVMSADTLSTCVGDQSILSASGGNSYLWSTGSTATSITVAPVTTSYYWVKTTVGNCTSKGDSVHIYVDTQIPLANAGADENICRYDSVQLSASGGNLYKWIQGSNIVNDSIFNPIVHPTATSVYLVQVTNIVCKDTATVTVNVDKCLTELPTKIPQIITPNGDGKNDYLVIDDIDYFLKSKITIYNRWSNEVYHAAPYNNEWNGKTNNGNDLPDGTYFIVLDLGNGHEVYTGYVMIQR